MSPKICHYVNFYSILGLNFTFDNCIFNNIFKILVLSIEKILN